VVLADVLRNNTPMDASPHLLLVDDDAEIRSLLSSYLKKNDFRVSTLPDGSTLRRTLERGNVDLLILDLMLPGQDGLQLWNELRATTDVPVIMLTARGDAVDRIIGLEVGADDYVTKPFEPRELLARIRNVLRRQDSRPRDPELGGVTRFEFDRWTLHTITRELRGFDGSVVKLTGGEYRMLALLLAASNRVVPRSKLAEQLRGRAADPLDRSIDVRVSRLRQLLCDDARDPKYIKTVYGEGYLIGVPVTQVTE
jgi:two-component system OmpR family response regulator